MESYKEILKKISVLNAQAAQAKQRELGAVLKRIKQEIKRHGFTAADLGLTVVGAKGNSRQDKKTKGATSGRVISSSPRKSRATVPPKYRGPNGETWSGRGLRPTWLKAELASGNTLDAFLIQRD